MNELTHRGAVYGKGSGYGALGDALAVQLQHFEVASVTLLAPRSLLALISGGKHRLRTFGQRMADQGCARITEQPYVRLTAMRITPKG